MKRKCSECKEWMVRVPIKPENDMDVDAPYWICPKCEHMELVSYCISFYRDGEQEKFILVDKNSWTNAFDLLAKELKIFPLEEKEE